jgi:hypothetical protein
MSAQYIFNRIIAEVDRYMQQVVQLAERVKTDDSFHKNSHVFFVLGMVSGTLHANCSLLKDDQQLKDLAVSKIALFDTVIQEIRATLRDDPNPDETDKFIERLNNTHQQ